MRQQRMIGRAKGLALIAAGIAIAITSPVSAQRGCEGWNLVSRTGPSPRDFTAAVFDIARGVTVLFGGYDGATRGDTWEWDGVRWTLVSEIGPAPRTHHAMAYDSARGVTVLFGGASYSPNTWEWDGSEWRLVSETGPSGRHRHAMAYDSGRRVTVLFGGANREFDRLGDTWEWDGREWTLVAQSGPRPRGHHAMAYDPQRRVTVLHGGYAGPLDPNTYEWDGEQWRTYFAEGPGPKDGHRMVYDSVRGTTVLHGGFDPIHRRVWGWDGSRWSVLGTGGPAMEGHGLAFDSARGVIVLFGGAEHPGPRYGDTWEWSGGTRQTTLTVEATCPTGGPISISWECATPDHQGALFFASDRGLFVIPSRRRRPCVGTALDLNPADVQIVWHGAAGLNGSRTIRGAAPGRACGGHLQLLDVATCATSNVALIE